MVRGLGAGATAVVAIPGVRYLLDPLHRIGTKDGNTFRRVARLDELEPGVPKEVVLTGTRVDAWTVHRDEVVGRVWLQLDQPADGAADGDAAEGSDATADDKTTGDSKAAAADASPQVTAFTAVCPHEGCIVQLAMDHSKYVCPCHQAEFELSGDRVPAAKLGRPNASPRDLDTLKTRIVKDDATDEQWVEVLYQKFRTATNVKQPVDG